MRRQSGQQYKSEIGSKIQFMVSSSVNLLLKEPPLPWWARIKLLKKPEMHGFSTIYLGDVSHHLLSLRLNLPTVVELLSCVWLFATHELQHARLPYPSLSPWVCSNSCPLSLPSNHLILCHPLLLPSVFPSFRVFSSESALCIRPMNLFLYILCVFFNQFPPDGFLGCV